MGGGDAVNFTDPFGLCDDGTAWCAFVNGVARQTAPMNRAAEKGAKVALGVSGAGDVMDAIGEGSVVGGAIAVAGMLPVGRVAKAVPAIGKIKGALEEVHGIVGKLPKGAAGKFGSPQRGTSVTGYRLDPAHPNAAPGSPEAGWHINYWNWTNGKKGSGGIWGAVGIPPE